jgi:hypothetical protein
MIKSPGLIMSSLVFGPTLPEIAIVNSGFAGDTPVVMWGREKLSEMFPDILPVSNLLGIAPPAGTAFCCVVPSLLPRMVPCLPPRIEPPFRPTFGMFMAGGGRGTWGGKAIGSLLVEAEGDGR